MKTLITLLMTALVSQAFATDYSACQWTPRICENPTSCADHWECLKKEQKKLNALVLKAIEEIEIDQIEMCSKQREQIEVTMEGHAMTIECMDTPDGPVFGG